LELLEEARTRKYRSPIIFLTGRGEYRIDVEAMKGGAADYLTKEELTAGLLERSIRYATERAQAREALEKAYLDLEEKVKERTRELTEVNTSLKKSAEDIKFFAYAVSHDLKSPAISIHGLANRLSKTYGKGLNERGVLYCDQISRAAEEIAMLVENINVYISEKESPLSVEELFLRDILQVIEDEFRSQLSLRGIHWVQTKKLSKISADRLSLIRAFRNLVDNALKYGGEGLSEIKISTESSPQFQILSVSDDGVGIQRERLKRIFRPFERNKSSERTQGTGLGLAIVKEIAERHQGEVWAEPSPKGGMTVSFSVSRNL
jgi:light-regulated signal transduction histidine kinase (bacteriophytochrome)